MSSGMANLPSNVNLPTGAATPNQPAPAASTPMAPPGAAPPSQNAAGPGQSPGATGEKGEFYNKMYTAIYNDAVAKGLPNPESVARLGAAQSSLETGYGKHIVGNNAFGIKGKGTAGSVNAKTQEFENGQMVNTKANFAAFNTVEESASGYVDFLLKNKRYKGVLAAQTPEEAIAAQAKTGYATDPKYGAKLAAINASMAGDNLNVASAGVENAQMTPTVVVAPVAAGGGAQQQPKQSPSTPPAIPPGRPSFASVSGANYRGFQVSDISA